MGRTVPTYRNLLERVAAGWDGFRRALRREDQEAFDGLMGHARSHASAASMCPLADPQDSLVMSILVEHEKELARLRRGLSREPGMAPPGAVCSKPLSANCGFLRARGAEQATEVCSQLASRPRKGGQGDADVLSDEGGGGGGGVIGAFFLQPPRPRTRKTPRTIVTRATGFILCILLPPWVLMCR